MIETKRLILREFNENDAYTLFEILSDKDVNKFLPMFPLKNIEEAKDIIKHYKEDNGIHYAICFKEDNICIGYVHVSGDESHDFGYGLKKYYWHQGIVSEAALGVIEALKSMDIPYITATHDVNNPHSGDVMKKIGMTYKYSYEELWQPKNFLVTFRMYQYNFHVKDDFVYDKYWNIYENHFIEDI